VFFWLNITAVSFIPNVPWGSDPRAFGWVWKYAHRYASVLLLDVGSMGLEDPKFAFEGLFFSVLLLSVVFALSAIGKHADEHADDDSDHEGKEKVARNRCRKIVTSCATPIEYLASFLYMSFISILTRGLVCSTPTEDNDAGLLVAANEIKCFRGLHLAMAPCALVGICCLYPAVVLTRPLFQALGRNKNRAPFELLFGNSYLFYIGQVQTVLAVVATFFADSVYIVLVTSLVADVLIIGYFLTKAPCSIPSVNTTAVVAYGFSLWINIASLTVAATGNGLIGSLMISALIGLLLILFMLKTLLLPLKKLQPKADHDPDKKRQLHMLDIVNSNRRSDAMMFGLFMLVVCSIGSVLYISHISSYWLMRAQSWVVAILSTNGFAAAFLFSGICRRFRLRYAKLDKAGEGSGPGSVEDDDPTRSSESSISSDTPDLDISGAGVAAVQHSEANPPAVILANEVLVMAHDSPLLAGESDIGPVVQLRYEQTLMQNLDHVVLSIDDSPGLEMTQNANSFSADRFSTSSESVASMMSSTIGGSSDAPRADAPSIGDGTSRHGSIRGWLHGSFRSLLQSASAALLFIRRTLSSSVGLFAADKASFYFYFASNILVLLWSVLLVEQLLTDDRMLRHLALVVTGANDLAALFLITTDKHFENQILVSAQHVIENERRYNGFGVITKKDKKKKFSAKRTPLWYPLTFWQHFTPLSNLAGLISFVFFWLNITAVSFIPNVPWGSDPRAFGWVWKYAHRYASVLLLDVGSMGLEDPKFAFEGLFFSVLLLSVMFALGATKKFRNLSKESVTYFRQTYVSDRISSRRSMYQRALYSFANGLHSCLAPIDYITNLLYMSFISVLTRGLVCSTPTEHNDAGLLVAANEIKCFSGLHLAMAPCALVGICCLYPAVVLTRPVSQIYKYLSTVSFRADYTFLKKKKASEQKAEEIEADRANKKKQAEFDSEQSRLGEEKQAAIKSFKSPTAVQEFKDIQVQCDELQEARDEELKRLNNDQINRKVRADRLKEEEDEAHRQKLECARKEIGIEGAQYARDITNITSHHPPRYVRVDRFESQQLSNEAPATARRFSAMEQYLFKNLDEHWYVGDNSDEKRQAKLRSSREESLTATTFQWEWAKNTADADKWAASGTPLALRADVKAFKFMFDYNYIFFLGQVQTVLAVVATFFADRVYIVLVTSFVADVLIIAYFLTKAPCSIPSINTIAVAAYGFSLWINVASLIVAATGNDFIASLMIITYVAFVCAMGLLIRMGVISMGFLLSVQTRAQNGVSTYRVKRHIPKVELYQEPSHESSKSSTSLSAGEYFKVSRRVVVEGACDNGRAQCFLQLADGSGYAFELDRKKPSKIVCCMISTPEQGQIKGGILDVVRNWNSPNLQNRYSTRVVWGFSTALILLSVLWTQPPGPAGGTRRGLIALSSTGIAATAGFVLLLKLVRDELAIHESASSAQRSEEQIEARLSAAMPFRVLCFLLYLSSNCLALVSMMVEDFDGLGGKKTGVKVFYAVLGNDFVALFGLTCWKWCSMGKTFDRTLIAIYTYVCYLRFQEVCSGSP
jgi:hypothetical protein